MPKKQRITENIEIPKGVTVSVANGIFKVKGAKGEVSRNMLNKNVSISIKDNLVEFSSDVDGKKTRKMMGTYSAHLRNMLRGAMEGHKYLLKICSGHFPMNVSVSKNEFVVKNLLGEKIPRVLRLDSRVSVKVDGEQVVVESVDKEIAGQCAASIEQLAKRPSYDTRIFQDGIYIISKDGKDIK